MEADMHAHKGNWLWRHRGSAVSLDWQNIVTAKISEGDGGVERLLLHRVFGGLRQHERCLMLEFTLLFNMIG